MRTTTAAQDTANAAAAHDEYLKVEVENGSGTWIELTDLDGFDWVENVVLTQTVDQPLYEARFEIRRDRDDTAGNSLAPLITASPLNVNDVSAYSALLDPGRGIRFDVAVMSAGSAPSAGDYERMFTGVIDSVDVASETIEVIARSALGADVVDSFIETRTTYGSGGGTAMETVMQSILTDWTADNPTLYTPTTPSFLITEGDWHGISVREALTRLSALIGWTVEERWDDGTSAFRLTLRDPDRTKSVVDWTFGVDDYFRAQRAELARYNIRNAVKVTYYDSAGTLQTVTATDATSISRFGRRWMMINEPEDSPIDTSGEAATMAEAIRDDLASPDLEWTVEARFFWPIQLGDLYTFSANSRHFDSDQDLAVVGFTHQIRKGALWKTTIQTRGAPVGYANHWRTIETAKKPKKLTPGGGVEKQEGAVDTYTATSGGIATSGGELVFDASTLNDEGVAMVAGDRFVIWDSGEAGTGSRQMNPANVPLSLFNDDIGASGDAHSAVGAGLEETDPNTVAVLYDSASNVVLAATGGLLSSIASADSILISDQTDNVVHYTTVSDFEAALTIGEAQITDGAILCRVAANETITGQWTFEDRIDLQHTGAIFARFGQTDGTADQRYWDIRTDAAGDFELRSINDAGTSVAHVLNATHAGVVTFPAGLSAGVIDSGSLSAAYIALGNGLRNEAGSLQVDISGFSDTQPTLVAADTMLVRDASGAAGSDHFEVRLDELDLSLFDNSSAQFTQNAIDSASTGLVNVGGDVQVEYDSAANIILAAQGGLLSSIAGADSLLISDQTDNVVHYTTVSDLESALTISESQITDGSILARVGGTETITGTWTWSGGSLEVNSTNSAGNVLRIRRLSGDGESVSISVSDSIAEWDYLNDENLGTIRFRIDNTDTESGGGANANNQFLDIHGDENGIRLRASTSGSATYPTYTWDGDDDTGMYRVGANQLGFTTGGTVRMTIGTAGEITVANEIRANGVAATDPAFTFDGDEDTGLFSPGANILGLAAGGVEHLRIDNTDPDEGRVSIDNAQFWVNEQATALDSATVQPDFDLGNQVRITNDGTMTAIDLTTSQIQDGASYILIIEPQTGAPTSSVTWTGVDVWSNGNEPDLTTSIGNPTVVMLLSANGTVIGAWYQTS